MKPNIKVIGPEWLAELAMLAVENIKANSITQAHILNGSCGKFTFKGYPSFSIKTSVNVQVPTIEITQFGEIEFQLPKTDSLLFLGIENEELSWLNFAVKNRSSPKADILIHDIASNQLTLKCAAKVFGISESRLEADLLMAELYQSNPAVNTHLAEYKILWPAFLSDDSGEYYVDVPAYIMWSLRAELF